MITIDDIENAIDKLVRDVGIYHSFTKNINIEMERKYLTNIENSRKKLDSMLVDLGFEYNIPFIL